MDSYAIKFKDFYGLILVDGSCAWRGWEYLLKDFQLETYIEDDLK